MRASFSVRRVSASASEVASTNFLVARPTYHGVFRIVSHSCSAFPSGTLFPYAWNVICCGCCCCCWTILFKSLHNSQDNHRTTWISGDTTTVQPGPNHSYAAWNWDLSLRFNKSSQESKIWIRSHKYLSIHKQEKHVPQFDSQRLTKVTQDGLNGNSKKAVVPCKRASDMDCRTVRLFQMPNGVHSDRRVRSSPKQLHQSTTP